MYTSINYKTKKALKEAVKEGVRVRVFSPGPFPAPHNGSCVIEGSQPHRWYASVRINNGIITEVK